MSPPRTVEKPQAAQVRCEKCPLRANKAFREFEKSEFSFVTSFKRGELSVEAGATIFLEDTDSAHLFTVLSGWAFRYKMLHDGRRQILNFALPGDILGLQASVFGHLDHSVEALSDVVLCVFQREKLWKLYKSHPGLAFDITWLASREERFLDESLLSIGRRTAEERLSYMLLLLFERAQKLGLTTKTTAQFPLTQDHLADALGLSLVHTNKTLRKLVKRGYVAWKSGELHVRDSRGLAKIANYDFEDVAPRPFI